jgi:caffeoyl-CoA O-methyltransferase
MGRMVSPSAQVVDYLARFGGREIAAQIRCRQETAKRADAEMQITAEQAATLAVLARLVRAERCIEVGVFTGYSALAVALVLPPGGRIVALDVSEEFTSLARDYWREGGVTEKIELRIGPAAHALDDMIRNGEGPFDFAFIDADKKNYSNYFERAMQLVRTGGVIATDNVLWDGRVADPKETDEDTEAIRAFNTKLHADARITLSIIPLGDGLTVACKL